VTLRISSTLSGRKELFQPRGDTVLMYVCGMTPKFHPHVGHARLFVAMDVIRRYLEHRGYPVKHVQNFTDIDDKIIARAQQEGTTAEEVAGRYSRSYFEAMDALGVQRAHVYPTVTQYMPQIIQFVQGLIERGHAYAVDGDVYFEVARFPDYGKLSGRTTDEGQMVGVRKELEPGKRDPRDFALWKRAKPGEPAWESPWGAGRPGWHIECSTMVRETLADQIDIHGGGQDLIFPHHENEIAQSESYTGEVPFAAFWPHVGLVTTGGEKMSHSLNNFTTVQQVLDKYPPMALRYFLLQTHYRSPISFSEKELQSKARGVQRLGAALEGFEPGQGISRADYVQPFVDAFHEAMDDDFNTAGGLGHLFDLAREINRRRSQGGSSAEVRAGQASLIQLASVLGLDLQPSEPEALDADLEPFIELLIETRRKLREAKQWQLADEVREGLARLGVALEDRPGATRWKRVQPAR
jgi:cysteinyl-tRNA synthetase